MVKYDMFLKSLIGPHTPTYTHTHTVHRAQFKGRDSWIQTGAERLGPVCVSDYINPYNEPSTEERRHSNLWSMSNNFYWDFYKALWKIIACRAAVNVYFYHLLICHLFSEIVQIGQDNIESLYPLQNVF